MTEEIMFQIEEKIILFEDNKNSRDTIMDNLRDHINSGLIILPESILEIPKLISNLNHDKITIVTDFDLSNWVGDRGQNPIIIEDNEYKNGLDLLEYFYEDQNSTNLYIYSANSDQLGNMLKSSRVSNSANIIPKGKKHGLSYIADFIENKINEIIKVNIEIKPIHKIDEVISNNVLYFFYKKIFKANPDDTIWKAGKYVWLVGFNNVNIPIIDKSSAPESDTIYYENEIEKYSLIRDYSEYVITEFSENNKRYLKREDIVSYVKKGRNINNLYKDITLIEEYFIVKVIYEEYNYKKINFNNYIKFLKSLSPIAQLESQKLLFLNAQKLTSKKLNSKEDIYLFLAEFYSNGFDKVLDVFEGHVKAIKEDKAYIHLESQSPEDSDRDEVYDINFINNNNLEKDSIFEYTIFKSFATGSLSYQIIPL